MKRRRHDVREWGREGTLGICAFVPMSLGFKLRFQAQTTCSQNGSWVVRPSYVLRLVIFFVEVDTLLITSCVMEVPGVVTSIVRTVRKPPVISSGSRKSMVIQGFSWAGKCKSAATAGLGGSSLPWEHSPSFDYRFAFVTVTRCIGIFVCVLQCLKISHSSNLVLWYIFGYYNVLKMGLSPWKYLIKFNRYKADPDSWSSRVHFKVQHSRNLFWTWGGILMFYWQNIERMITPLLKRSEDKSSPKRFCEVTVLLVYMRKDG